MEERQSEMACSLRVFHIVYQALGLNLTSNASYVGRSKIYRAGWHYNLESQVQQLGIEFE